MNPVGSGLSGPEVAAGAELIRSSAFIIAAAHAEN